MIDTYLVWAKHLDREQFLGVATGEKQDIEAFYDDKKAYGLILQNLVVDFIPPGYSNSKNQLLLEKARLEAKIAEIDRKIKKV